MTGAPSILAAMRWVPRPIRDRLPGWVSRAAWRQLADVSDRRNRREADAAAWRRDFWDTDDGGGGDDPC